MIRDADRIFHREWLGLAQPIEGLVFSVPVLAEAQIAPAARPEITASLRAHLIETPRGLALRDPRAFFQTFLGYDRAGMLPARDALPGVSFYAPEARQEVRPSFALARGPFERDRDDPFAEFDTPSDAPAIDLDGASPYLALVWDLGDDCADPSALDLDAPEDATGPWRYSPTAKLERLLRHVGVPVGLLTNRRHLRVVYAPPGEATSHLTFRFDDLADPAGRPLALALELLFSAQRTHTADARFTFAGLLAESRRRQADVTEELAQQVFEAVERLLEGYEAAAARDVVGDRPDWLRGAMEQGQLYDGVLNVVLRLVFLLYAEDRSLLPVEHPTYAAHLSVLGLYERLASDAGAHPESMHQRYGAYGALVSLFRAVYFGVHHGELRLPARQGRLFDPSAYPFLEGGLPDWTAAVRLPEERAAVRLPTLDDGTLYQVLHRLVVLDGQRLSYRDLSVEQIGAVYESLMGYRVARMSGPAVRLGKLGFWVEVDALRKASKTERDKLLSERCGLSKAAIKKVLEALKEADGSEALADRLVELSPGKKSERPRHRARDQQLVLQPTASRRSTGSHYTPRSLSERVVRRTLEPILACLGEAPSAADVLSLKVCDPAMGSGAFLVEACRYLGDAVVAAWGRSGELAAVLEKHGDPVLHAKRLVAQRCLYGVDKNAAAVELAKLSLWLETLSGDKAFTFLDHVLRHGDSLVGLDVEQVRAFHWSPERQLETVAPLVDLALAEVREHRDAIHALADDESDHAQREKRRLLELAEQAMARVKLVADVCVGAFFAEAKKNAREKERDARLKVVEAYLAGDDGAAGQIEAWARVIREQHAPFHWHLELPEVFFLERPDPLERGVKNRAAFVDAFVGNPPFMGQARISGELGEAYRDWLFAIHPGTGGKSDLSPHFFRRAAHLLGAHGTMGLVATNTISQGDTRVSGLQALLARADFTIYDATRDLRWPGAADVIVSVAHLARGAPAMHIGAPRLDGQVVPVINSRLGGSPERADPVPLHAMSGFSYKGAMLYGLGFTITADERASLVATAPHSAERIFPYLGGQELNTSPMQSYDRYAINFGQMSLAEAARWPELLALVRERVKPERDQLRDNTDGRDLKARWWQFGRSSPGLGQALAELDRCLVTARITKHLCFSFQPTNRILNEKVYVLPLPAITSFAVLQSRTHESWTRLLSSVFGSSTIGAVLNYSASDCFETFPFPQPDPRTVIPELETIGQRLYDERAAYMIDTQQGLTQTYNKLKDPACTDAPILALRQLHESMDRAVLQAYAWPDLEVPPFCPTTTEEQKSLETFQDQVIDRLFVLNAERAKEERRLGLDTKKPKPAKASKQKPKSAKSGRPKPKPATKQEGLGFED